MFLPEGFSICFFQRGREGGGSFFAGGGDFLFSRGGVFGRGKM